MWIQLLPQLEGSRQDRAFVWVKDHEDEQTLAECAAALAPHLTGESARRALEWATKIRDEWHRARAMQAFLPFSADPDDLRNRIRTAVVDYLQGQTERRSDVLRLCADESLFRQPAFSSSLLGDIATAIIETCWDWHWQ
jgi:hypothetical protein